jgi:hypothetical protein
MPADAENTQPGSTPGSEHNAVNAPRAATSGGEHASIFDLIKIILSDPKLSSSEKKALIDEVRKNSPTLNDRWLYRWAIWMLGVTVIITALSFSALSWVGAEIPQGLVALGSGAASGLAGLLAPSPKAASGDGQ